MSKVHVTEKGTKLPIMNLKGRDYMMVAHRIVWFRETYPLGTILTEAVKIENDYAIFKAVIAIPDATGNLVRLATATKKEDQKGFPDFIEKAETGSIGRALALAGFGTQFSIPELDEGDRLADSPLQMPTSSVVNVKVQNGQTEVMQESIHVNDTTHVAKRVSFRKPKTDEQKTGWGT
jgi:hypothetical protein